MRPVVGLLLSLALVYYGSLPSRVEDHNCTVVDEPGKSCAGFSDGLYKFLLVQVFDHTANKFDSTIIRCGRVEDCESPCYFEPKINSSYYCHYHPVTSPSTPLALSESPSKLSDFDNLAWLVNFAITFCAVCGVMHYVDKCIRGNE